MKFNKKHLVAGIALSATLVLSACGGNSGDDATGVTGGAMVSNDFAFPAVIDIAAGEGIEKPVGSAPEFSARRTLVKGEGEAIQYGDPVVLKYNMYSWSTGELVDSTDLFDEAESEEPNREPLTVRAGVTNGIPDYLTKSLLGRQIGETLQVVFERGMEDLPSYLSDEDAYVLIVSLK